MIRSALIDLALFFGSATDPGSILSSGQEVQAGACPHAYSDVAPKPGLCVLSASSSMRCGLNRRCTWPL